MSDAPDTVGRAFGDIAPKLAELTDTVVFGDIWKRPDHSPRDRSLITSPPSRHFTGPTSCRSI